MLSWQFKCDKGRILLIKGARKHLWNVALLSLYCASQLMLLEWTGLWSDWLFLLVIARFDTGDKCSNLIALLTITGISSIKSVIPFNQYFLFILNLHDFLRLAKLLVFSLCHAYRLLHCLEVLVDQTIFLLSISFNWHALQPADCSSGVLLLNFATTRFLKWNFLQCALTIIAHPDILALFHQVFQCGQLWHRLSNCVFYGWLR